MLRAIFSNNLDSKLSGSISGTTPFQYLGFIIFWTLSLPAIWFPPQTIRHLFTAKAAVVPIAGIAFLIWAIVKAGGIGPVVHQETTISGSKHGWAFIASLMNCIANFATLILNAPDFSRFAKTKKSSFWSQAISIPFCFALTSLIGILVSSASTIIYGRTYWSPLDVLGLFLENYKSGNRAGVFFIAFAFALAQLGTNISANSLSAGTDMTALLPRYISIRRGGFICAAISLCICPWNFFKSSNNFTSYLSSYSVFLSAISGVVFSDYFWVRRGLLKLLHLYTGDKNSDYRFNKIGVNWRAYVAYICGILINIVGFAGDVGQDVPIGATYIYRLNYFCGFIISFVLYGVLSHFFPFQGIPISNIFKDKGWFQEWQEVDDFEVSKDLSVVEYGEAPKPEKSF
ncbi:uncharacterized protein ASCRUDRAFT_73466 [Ascoidea rubescens DSM 1968]|uniref:Uracil permease n=1 Tax=Ascoidea rubescens DSM 1968 TaxID=1344418 RepID=A0A1D2VQ37_9ASCO|nr:hypothetical protein ASCRUDRAFT_73466 [Ascoidea rubescens DSM 1968]ODV63657.1 hypothetical protein ASCRUDRAFT_73466 [Ascoidea rubescens DSM 1968]